ncbi:MAG TPA: cell cycle transcriptional regulator TrcR, partial [Geminicoccaceae bacterium]|nr:cell cycle transcriptional regulator TrcR [Geminicoccaceae bacterium]
QDRPDAIAWLLRNHPELSDQQICKLLGTTKATVNAVRERTHWKSAEIRPRDPVLIGLCSQVDLDAAVIEARVAQKERESREMAAAEEALAALDQDDS